MEKDREEFSDEIKRKVLLWSDRHCCVCGKASGLDIEIAHLANEGIIENALPACYDCHARVGRYVDGKNVDGQYSNSHPRGSKYRIDELRKRRDQIYERHTSHLVPGILPAIYPNPNGDRANVIFIIQPVGKFIPVKAKLVIRVFLDGEDLGMIQSQKPYYSGIIVWNLNAGTGVKGNFSLPEKCGQPANKGKELQLELSGVIIDPYEREHELLPVCFTHVWGNNSWFLEPTGFIQLKPFLNLKAN